MEVIKLETKTRDLNESTKTILSSSFVPAILYGTHVKENINLQVKSVEVEKAFIKAGESTLIDLVVDGKESVKVIIKDVQKDVLKDTLIHVDFYQVDMKEEINTEINFNFIGESKAVKELGGMLIKSMNSIEVKCLPGALVNHIDIDISGLNTFSDSIKLQDLNLPEGIKLVHETNDLIVGVSEPRIMEETEGTEEVTEATEEKKEEKVEEKK